MSKYAEAWKQLKESKTLVLSIPPSLQKRIIKAIIRIKDEDVGFKLQCSEVGKKYKLEYTVETAKVTIKLVEYLADEIPLSAL